LAGGRFVGLDRRRAEQGRNEAVDLSLRELVDHLHRRHGRLRALQLVAELIGVEPGARETGGGSGRRARPDRLGDGNAKHNRALAQYAPFETRGRDVEPILEGIEIHDRRHLQRILDLVALEVIVDLSAGHGNIPARHEREPEELQRPFHD
jgi:hypothetical protein